MKKQKFSKEFEIFSRACEEGIQILGLTRFRREYQQKYTENALASCHWDFDAARVTFSLCNKGENACRSLDAAVESAAHECLELLLAETDNFIRRNALYCDRVEIMRHAQISALEPMLIEAIGKKIWRRP